MHHPERDPCDGSLQGGRGGCFLRATGVPCLYRSGYAQTIRAMLEAHLPTEWLSKITAPTLVLMGAEAPVLKAAHLTQSKILGAQFVIPWGRAPVQSGQTRGV